MIQINDSLIKFRFQDSTKISRLPADQSHKELKLQSLEKKKDKKRFGPDSQDHIQPS